MNRHAQQGMAVVVAILLIALATSIAALMLSRQDLWSRQVENLAQRAQAEIVSLAGIEAMQRALLENAQTVDLRPIREAAATTMAALSIRGVRLEITYADAQARFNLNNLVRGDRVSEPDVQAYRGLLTIANLPPDLANAVVDAIDSDSDTRLPGGAEDLDYLMMDPPRRAANQAMTEAAHLVRLKGYTPDAVSRLLPYVTALPEATVINLNSAPAEALMALAPGLDMSAAQGLIAAREQAPFADLNAFRAQLPAGVTLTSGIATGVTSQYFVVVSSARVGRIEVAYQALIGRQGAAKPGVIWRKHGSE